LLDCFSSAYTSLLGLTENFYDEIKTLPLDDDISEQATGVNYGSNRMGKFNKRKVSQI
jgi:U3 small nucleolar ribonucleoprotein protein LCP5